MLHETSREAKARLGAAHKHYGGLVDTITESQVNYLKLLSRKSGKKDSELKKYVLKEYGFKRLEDILRDDFKEIMRWAKARRE